jgi:hypothetical protein
LTRHHARDRLLTGTPNNEGVSVGREALEAKAKTLQSQMQGLVFINVIPIYQTSGSGYLAWKLRPEGGDPAANGFDVAIGA